MPEYVVFSRAALRDSMTVTALGPLEAVKKAAEGSRGGGRYLCVAVTNLTYARADSDSQTVANVTQEAG